MRGMRHVLDGAVKRDLVRLRRPVEAGELAHELERRGAHFVVRRRRLEIVESFYIPAHSFSSKIGRVVRAENVHWTFSFWPSLLRHMAALQKSLAAHPSETACRANAS